MMWYQPKIGEKKKKREFMLFPLTLNGMTVWMQWITIEYEYKTTAKLEFYGAVPHDMWVPICFRSYKY